jgi:hypothetical protein
MKRVRITRAVPLLIDGKPIHAKPGDRHTVEDDIAESLIRGGDAEIERGAEPAAEEPADQAPRKPGKIRMKDMGQAPHNKGRK